MNTSQLMAVCTREDRILIDQVRMLADAKEKKYGKKAVVHLEIKDPGHLGRIDCGNEFENCLYINIPGLKFARIRGKKWGIHVDQYIEEYIAAVLELADLAEGREAVNSYFEGIAACFFLLKREEKGSYCISIPDISRLIRGKKVCNWTTDDLFCELSAERTALSRAEKALSAHSFISLSLETEIMELLSQMPEVAYDRKGNPCLASHMILDQMKILKSRRTGFCDKYSVLCILNSIGSKEKMRSFLQDHPDKKSDPFYRGSAARLSTNWRADEENRGEFAETFDYLNEVFGEFEKNAIRYIRNSVNEGTILRDNRTAIERTLKRIAYYYERNEIIPLGGRVHSLGYR